MRYLFTACLLLLNYSLFSQTYDLNSYKFRYQKWRQMGVNFNFSGNHDQNSSFSENTLYNFYQRGDTVITAKANENSHKMSFFAPFSYHSFVNTENLQQDQSFGYNIESGKMKDQNRRDISTNQSLNYRIDNRFYKGKNFTEVNFSSGNFLYSQLVNHFAETKPVNYHKSSHMQFNLGYKISIGKGRGRMEYVTDAVSAMFLLRDLKSKAGTGQYSNEQIESVAKGITSIRNQRYMDFRFGVVDQLTMLDSILKTNNITSENAMRYFTTLNDNWLLATSFQRFSGSRWSVNLLSEGNFDRNKNVQIFRDTNLRIENTVFNRKSFEGLSFNYSNAKQLGLFLQRTYGFGVSSGINFTTSEQTSTMGKNKIDFMHYIINGDWGYLFQPNTRTYLTLYFSGSAIIQNTMHGLRTRDYSDQKSQGVAIAMRSELQFFRFISPRLYYNSNIAFNYYENGNRYSNTNSEYKTGSISLPFDFSMGLTYLFF